MPSPGLRFAGETAFLVLVALGLGLAHFDPIVIVAVMAVAWVLVALLERASSREAARGAGQADEEEEPPAAAATARRARRGSTGGGAGARGEARRRAGARAGAGA